jgi:hypothetical protein
VDLVGCSPGATELLGSRGPRKKILFNESGFISRGSGAVGGIKGRVGVSVSL